MTSEKQAHLQLQHILGSHLLHCLSSFGRQFAALRGVHVEDSMQIVSSSRIFTNNLSLDFAAK